MCVCVGGGGAASVQPAIPVFTTLLAILFKFEVLNWRSLHGWLKLIGIAAAVAGAVVVVALGSKQGGTTDTLIIGNVCLLINCLSMAIYVLLQKRVLVKPPQATSDRGWRGAHRLTRHALDVS